MNILISDTKASMRYLVFGLIIGISVGLIAWFLVSAFFALGIIYVENEDINICDLCEKDVNKTVTIKDYKNFELVKYSKRVVFKCFCKQVIWQNNWPLWVYLFHNSKCVSKKPKNKYNNDDFEMELIIRNTKPNDQSTSKRRNME